MKLNTHKHKKKHFLTFSVYVFILLFAGNLVAAYVMHFYVLGTSCMTKAQVASDSRCLYIVGNQIYQKDSRNSPHHGHPCGTDVTSVLPADHINNPAAHLLPNLIASVCAAATPTPKPTATPTPRPTVTPTSTLTPTIKPTVTPTVTPTFRPVATFTPIPTATFTPVPQLHATATMVPTAIRIPTPTTIKITVAPTPVTPTKRLLTKVITVPTTPQFILTVTPTITPVQPSETMIPTQSMLTSTPAIQLLSETPTPSVTVSPSIPALNMTVSLLGIDSRIAPKHVEKPISVFVYKSTDNLSSIDVQPLQTIQGSVSFDTGSGFFTNPAVNLSNVAEGQYQLVIEVPGYIKKQLINGENAIFSLSPGVSTQIPLTKLLGGDIDKNNVVDIADYNGLLRCYGLSVLNPSPTCANPQTADLNDDGLIDATDYNIFLYSLYAYRQENNLLPSPTVIPVITPSISVTATPTATLTTTPFATPTPMVTSITKQVITPAKKKQIKISSVPTSTITPQRTSIFAGITDNASLLTKIFDIIVFLILCITLFIGFVRSKIFTTLTEKLKPPKKAAIPPTTQTFTKPKEMDGETGVVK